MNQRATATAKPGFVNTDVVGPGDKGYDAVSRGQINQAQAQLSKSLARNAVSAGASSINTNLPTYQNVQLPGSSVVAVAAAGDVRRYSAVSTGELRDAESQADLNAATESMHMRTQASTRMSSGIELDANRRAPPPRASTTSMKSSGYLDAPGAHDFAEDGDATWFGNTPPESDLAASDVFVGFPGDATVVDYDPTEPLDLDDAS